MSIGEFTILCTEQQTKIAFQLSAPVDVETRQGHYIKSSGDTELFSYGDEHDVATLPTTEQMCGWLRHKGFRFKFDEHGDSVRWKVSSRSGRTICSGSTTTYPDAVLNAIDTCLEYLTNHRL